MNTINITPWYYKEPSKGILDIYGGYIYKGQDKVINIDNITWITKDPQTLETWNVTLDTPTGWFKAYKSPTIRKGDTIKHEGFKYLKMNCGTKFLVKAEELDSEFAKVKADLEVVVKND